MAKGHPLTDDDKLRICELIDQGMRNADIARKVGLSEQSVSRVRNEFYGKDIRSMDVVIAGNKKYGTLTAVGPDHYVGTCLVKGKMKKRHFNIKGSQEAIKAWEEWKDKVITPQFVQYGNHAASGMVDRPKTHITMPVTIPNTENVTVIDGGNIPRKEPEYSVATGGNVIKAPEPQELRKFDSTIYILAVGNPKLASWFLNEDEARKAMRIANQALEYAGVDIRYTIQTVGQNL